MVALAGCQAAPQSQSSASPHTATAVPEMKSTQQTVAPQVNDCGIAAFPVSMSTQQIVADGLQNGARSGGQGMLVKVAIDPNGNITHLRVLRPAYPDAANTVAINTQVVDSMKRRHYTPRPVDGKPVATCADVSVNVDLNK
jgi:hypothetical protein